MKICVDNPAALEAAFLLPAIRTIEAFHELGAPEPPHDSLAPHIAPTMAFETDVDPRIARTLGRSMQLRAFEIRNNVTHKRCRRGLHLLTTDNVVNGGCRACKMAAQRARRVG